MSFSSAEMHAYYAARAPIYDAVYARPERRADIEFLAAHLPARFAGRQVLEVACGTGYWTQYLARTAARMVATDGTAEPLAFARLRPGTEAVSFRLADAYTLPADLGDFDGAFAGLWFSHVPIAARGAFLDSLHARLTAGARVILIDNNEVQLRDFPIVEADADGNTYQRRVLPDGSSHRVLKNFPSQSEMQALLALRARNVQFQLLDNFWLCEYELA